jgi:hypothetical protein
MTDDAELDARRLALLLEQRIIALAGHADEPGSKPAIDYRGGLAPPGTEDTTGVRSGGGGLEMARESPQNSRLKPADAARHVRAVADAANELRGARLRGERLVLSEDQRALLSGAVLVLAWVSIEEAPTRSEPQHG